MPWQTFSALAQRSVPQSIALPEGRRHVAVLGDVVAVLVGEHEVAGSRRRGVGFLVAADDDLVLAAEVAGLGVEAAVEAELECGVELDREQVDLGAVDQRADEVGDRAAGRSRRSSSAQAAVTSTAIGRSAAVVDRVALRRRGRGDIRAAAAPGSPNTTSRSGTAGRGTSKRTPGLRDARRRLRRPEPPGEGVMAMPASAPAGRRLTERDPVLSVAVGVLPWVQPASAQAAVGMYARSAIARKTIVKAPGGSPGSAVRSGLHVN